MKDGDIHMYWEMSQKKILEGKQAKFLKTHNILGSINGIKFTKPEYSLGVIHIIRDPRNVITSIKNHLNFKSYEDAFNYMKSNDAFIKGEDSTRFAFVGSWRSHYTSWMSDQTLRRITVKYEDMEKNCEETFKKIIGFINRIRGTKEIINEKKLQNSIETTRFEKLKSGEEEGKFNENVIINNNKKVKFFYMGPKNKWENLLPEKMKNEMNDYFKNDISILKY